MKFYGGTVTGSLTVNGTQTINGTLTAQTLVVQTITSSISRITGSTQFGSSSINTHQFTGSLLVSGSSTALNINNGAFFISSSGFVGIGTTTPIYNDIVMPYAKTATTTNASFFIRSNEVVASNPFGLRFQIFGSSSLSGRYATLQTTDYNSADGGSIVLQPGGGNVGIGISTPLSILDVRTGAGTTGSILNLSSTTSANASNIVPIRFYAGNTFGGLEQIAAIWAANPNAGSNNGGTLYFGTSTNGTGATPSEKMRLDNDGTLNLGTYHSQAKFLPGADSNHYLRYNTSLDGLELAGYSGVMFSTLGGTERMRLTTAGNLGLNTNSPTTTFQIRKNYWQFWTEKSFNTNVNLFSITFTGSNGGAVVQFAGSRYSPGADNYSGVATYYVYCSNVGVVNVTTSSSAGTYGLSTSVSGNTITFYSAYAGTSTNYTGASISILASGHNVGSESAVTVAVL